MVAGLEKFTLGATRDPSEAEVKQFQLGIPQCRLAVGELLRVGVVVAQRVVVALALDGDAILRAGEFILQSQVMLVGLQLRIVLDNQQASERSVELSIGGNFLLWQAQAGENAQRYRRKPSALVGRSLSRSRPDLESGRCGAGAQCRLATTPPSPLHSC